MLIAGTIVANNLATNVLIRPLGPTLTSYGVPNALADPALALYDANGALVLLTITGLILSKRQSRRPTSLLPTIARARRADAGRVEVMNRRVRLTTRLGLLTAWPR